MNENFVDSTTLQAVESLFRGGGRDPWGARLAGQLADLFIYSDLLCYPVPDRGRDGLYDLAQVDGLLRDLVRRDSQAFDQDKGVYSTAEPRLLADEHLDECFENFTAWARANSKALKQWLAYNHEDWMQNHRWSTTAAEYTFDLDNLSKKNELSLLCTELNIPKEDIYYAFDSILKYPLFGELSGPNNYYLNHHIRDAFPLPKMTFELGAPPRMAVTFEDSITAIATKLTQDEYTELLHELRGQVQTHGLHRVGPGDFDQDAVREIAAKAKLPVRIKSMGKAAGLVGGVFGILGAFTPFASAAAILGGAVAIGSSFWQGRVPRAAGKVKWLRWALVWDIEEQSKTRTNSGP